MQRAGSRSGRIKYTWVPDGTGSSSVALLVAVAGAYLAAGQNGWLAVRAGRTPAAQTCRGIRAPPGVLQPRWRCSPVFTAAGGAKGPPSRPLRALSPQGRGRAVPACRSEERLPDQEMNHVELQSIFSTLALVAHGRAHQRLEAHKHAVTAIDDRASGQRQVASVHQCGPQCGGL